MINTPKIEWNRYIDGDNNALKDVFLSIHSQLVMTAYFYLKDEEQAKDVVADVFKKLLELSLNQRKEYLGNVYEKMGVFLKVVTKNKCLDIIKNEKRRKNILQRLTHYMGTPTYGSQLLEEDFKLILDLLPERQREILNLHLSGLKNDEISDKLNISYNTCRNTLSTAKKKIRELWVTFMD